MAHVLSRVTSVRRTASHLLLCLASCVPPAGVGRAPPRSAPPGVERALPEGEVQAPEPEVTPQGGWPEMIEIPAGKILRGSAEGPADERPAKEISLRAFAIDRTEVDVEAYDACVAQKGCTKARTGDRCTAGVAGREHHPINCVTWMQAEAYCKFAGKRLPTEAEWERAARGAGARRFVWGEAWPPPAFSGNFADLHAAAASPYWVTIPDYSDGFAATAPIDTFTVHTATPEGVWHMAGNVAEWIADWYDPSYYAKAPAADPTGPSRGRARVVRGGSFGTARAADLTTTRRQFYAPAETSMHIGFRCARSNEAAARAQP